MYSILENLHLTSQQLLLLTYFYKTQNSFSIYILLGFGFCCATVSHPNCF